MSESLVSLVDVLGSDLTVVNAARVSMHKQSTFKGVGPFPNEVACTEAFNVDPQAQRRQDGLPWMYQEGDGWFYVRLSDEDAKLIRYLANSDPQHFSPFTHVQIQLRIKMPLFLARQWYKHRIGIEKDCGWNEVSRRYVKDEPEFFLPKGGFRKAAEKVKQGSSDELVTKWGDKPLLHLVQAHYTASERLYKGMLEAGVAPEDARMVLPTALMTEWIETGSLMAYSRIVELRGDSHAQFYIRPYAEKISRICEQQFPVSWRALRAGAK